MRVSQALGALALASISKALNNENTDYASINTIQRRNTEIEARLANEPVYGVRKMSTDEGEKFYLDYWHFEDAAQGGLSERDLAEVYTNTTDANSQKPPIQNTGIGLTPAQFLARSYAFNPSSGPEVGVRGSSLEARDFKCPSDTNACASINRSDRCCSTGDTCVIVTDTGSGDVGCCPKGQTCSGTIGSCQSGYTTCSTALGGGCCIPGYECVEGGCKSIFPWNNCFPELITSKTGAYISVVTVTIESTVTVSTVTHTTSQQTTHSTSSSSSPSSTSSSSTSSSNTSTESLTPPARGTSITTTTHSSTTRIDVCPTGFYACSAVYNGGCCQTNRDCDTTSCPATSSTTFTSDGKTIAIPITTGSSGSSRTGKCPGGWFSCADTAGGGCCPSGYACGASICTATGSVATTVAKEAPTNNGAGVNGIPAVMLGVSLVVLMCGL